MQINAEYMNKNDPMLGTEAPLIVQFVHEIGNMLHIKTRDSRIERHIGLIIAENTDLSLSSISPNLSFPIFKIN